MFAPQNTTMTLKSYGVMNYEASEPRLEHCEVHEYYYI